MDQDLIERALVVTAHPDDVDFGAAGTVAAWTAAGCEVTYCILTDGDAGGFDPAVPRERIPEIRRAEQRAAGAEVGVVAMHFLGYPDGALYVTHDLRRDISRVIRQVRPQRIITSSPVRSYERLFASHPDHLAAGEATLCAVYPDARNPFAHPELLAEGLDAWTVSEVWLLAPGDTPNRYVDITDTFPAKIAALDSHVSQLQPDAQPGERERVWRERHVGLAEQAGFGPGRLAEAFYAVRTD
ncbi:MAG: PIG-L family deacetylase [Pseudonocardia sp.]|nr:PIG-L family deacetylase [Pseudonocardia sp.]